MFLNIQNMQGNWILVELFAHVSPVSKCVSCLLLRQWQCLSFMTPCLPVHKVLLSQCCAHCSNVCVSVFTSRNLCVFLPSGTAGGKATAAAAAAGVTAGQQESSSSKGKAPGVHSTGAFQCTANLSFNLHCSFSTQLDCLVVQLLFRCGTISGTCPCAYNQKITSTRFSLSLPFISVMKLDGL